MNKKLPLYLKYPIWQIVFLLSGLSLGSFISLILANITIGIMSLAAISIIKYFYEMALSLYVFSGALDSLMDSFVSIVFAGYEIILLILGLELISCKLNKLKTEENLNYGDRLKSAKDQILFKKSDSNF